MLFINMAWESTAACKIFLRLNDTSTAKIRYEEIGEVCLRCLPLRQKSKKYKFRQTGNIVGGVGLEFISNRVGSLNAPRHLRRARNVTNCSSFRLLHWFFKKQPKKQIKMAAIIQLKKTRDTRTSVKNNQTKEKLILSCGNAAVQRPHRHWNLIKIMA